MAPARGGENAAAVCLSQPAACAEADLEVEQEVRRRPPVAPQAAVGVVLDQPLSDLASFAGSDTWSSGADRSEAIRLVGDAYLVLKGEWVSWRQSELHRNVRQVLARCSDLDRRFWEGLRGKAWCKALSRELLDRPLPALTKLFSFGASLDQLRELAKAAKTGGRRSLPEFAFKAPFYLQAVRKHGSDTDQNQFLNALEKHYHWLAAVTAWALLVETARRQNQALSDWLVNNLNAYLEELRISVDREGMLHEKGPLLTFWLYQLLCSRQAETTQRLQLCEQCGLPAEPRSSRGPRPPKRLCVLCLRDLRQARWRQNKSRQRKSRSKLNPPGRSSSVEA